LGPLVELPSDLYSSKLYEPGNIDDGQSPKKKNTTLLQIITHHRQNPLDFLVKRLCCVVMGTVLVISMEIETYPGKQQKRKVFLNEFSFCSF
jgi:hypothetical protein